MDNSKETSKDSKQLQTNIVVTLQVEGLHCWPAARKEFPEVGYLSDPHRHIFHITAKKRVRHNDRDIEIIMFKKDMLSHIKRQWWDKEYCTHEFGPLSCEMLAKYLLETFSLDYCQVLEDNENGAEVYITQPKS